jgi:two-component system phosphate regulon sensor histidine kinase PhoR
MMQIALSKILDNAVRFSDPNGTIMLHGGCGSNELMIQVVDKGVGIEPEHLPRVVERLYRADSAHSTPGFGLGLSIADRILELHKGQLKIDSVLDVGTTITLTLPIDAPSAPH